MGVNALIKQHLKCFALKLIKTLGYDLVPARNNPDAYLDISRALEMFVEPRGAIFFDVGANIGQTVDWLLGKFPNSVIYCFEPDDSAYSELFNRFSRSPNVRCFSYAIGGHDGYETLNSNSASVTSSMLESSARVQGDAMYQCTRRFQVKLLRLDSFIKKNIINKIDFLKIDVQGYEQHVIDGLGEYFTPNFVKIICLELNFVNLYDGQANPGSVLNSMMQHGYKLYGLYEVHANYTDGITYLNALFVPMSEGK